MTSVRYLFVFALCISGCDCSQSHTRDASVDGATDAEATDTGTADARPDTSVDAGLCSSPTLYDEALCQTAPDVGLCVLAGREEEAQTLVPSLRCGTTLPRCDDDSVGCRYGQEDRTCDAMSVAGYNRAICVLWDAGLVTEVVPIPLD